MIKSKTPQLIDAQNQVSAIVYLDMSPAIHDRVNGLRQFNITTYIEVTIDGVTSLQGIKENLAVFKDETFLAIWGDLTLIEFNDQIDANLIAQIVYINSYEWDGTEAQSPVRFWSLEATDLEIVI